MGGFADEIRYSVYTRSNACVANGRVSGILGPGWHRIPVAFKDLKLANGLYFVSVTSVREGAADHARFVPIVILR